MENKIKKCKFCGNENKLIVVISTDKDGSRYKNGYECLECSVKRKVENKNRRIN